MRANLRQFRSAFSLVEVLLAIMILAIALTGLTRGVTTALTASKETELQTAAAMIAAAQIELLRAEGFIIAGETEGESGSLYVWKQAVVETTTEGLYEVTVTVDHSQQQQQLFELKTMLFDPPLDLTETEREDEKKNKARSGRGRGTG